MSKRFSEQFKQEAVGLVSPERPISEVADQLGVGHPRWTNGCVRTASAPANSRH